MKKSLIGTSGLVAALAVFTALAQPESGSSPPAESSSAQQTSPGGGMQACRQGKGMRGSGHAGMHHKGMHSGGRGKHGGGQGKAHDGPHLFGASWTKTLTVEQKLDLDKLHLAFARTKAPLKASVKALKAELAVQMTTEQPDKEALNSRLDELLRLKGEMLRAKYAYVAAQRQVLTPEQRVSFDMMVIHKAMHNKKRCEQHGCGGR